MGRAADGAKSGLVAGVPYGVILAILGYFTTLSMKQTIIQEIAKTLPANSPLTADQAFNIALFVEPAIVIIVGIVGGLILGAIYGWLSPKIPGGNAVVKGVIFGVVLWLIVSVLGGIGNLQYSLEYFAVQVASGFVASLLFGWFLGYFYGRFSRPKELLTGPT